MKRIIIATALAVAALAGCATVGPALGPSPEAQIVNGANLVAVGATIGGTLLKNNKITVTQAKSYRAILGTASEHLDIAALTLLECRKKTRSTSQSSPDPCAPTVADDIALALQIATEVHRTLRAK